MTISFTEIPRSFRTPSVTPETHLPTGPGWYWARQRPGVEHGDSCGWRPVYVRPSEVPGYPPRVWDFGDPERLGPHPEDRHSWDWGPQIEEPEEETT